MPSATTILKEPIVIANRLSMLGWAKEELLEVVFAAVSGRNSETLNDPPGAGGWAAYREGTRRLRELGIEKGYIRDTTDGISSVYDESRQLKIVFCNTDDATGRDVHAPQNRSRKGAATDRLVEDNRQQLMLFDDATFNNIVSFANTQIDRPRYWYLCVFSDGEIVRAELSCPLECRNGFFKGFSERIMLLTDDKGVTMKPALTDDAEDFTVEVTRKTS